MVGAVKYNPAFNKKVVNKLAEYYADYCRDEVTTWKRITLELLNEHEDQQYKLCWQDLRNYFKRSLVFHLSHLELTADTELVDRLQYPYLRKVYVVTIMLFDHYPTSGVSNKISDSIVRDNKLFIKYITNGNYDPLVVAAFKRHGKKGVRVYVPINVEDPIYQLTRDEIDFLLRVEQIRTDYNKRRKERSQVPSTAPIGTGSPIILDGVPVNIENVSQTRICSSARNLLEEESLTVNTQEYANIMKESLEQELPRITTDANRSSLNCANRSDSQINYANEIIYLNQDEILSAADSSVDRNNQDPLYLSYQSNNTSCGRMIACCGGNESSNSRTILASCKGKHSSINKPSLKEEQLSYTTFHINIDSDLSSDESNSPIRKNRSVSSSERLIANQLKKSSRTCDNQYNASIKSNIQWIQFPIQFKSYNQKPPSQSNNEKVMEDQNSTVDVGQSRSDYKGKNNELNDCCSEPSRLQNSSKDYLPNDFFSDDEDSDTQSNNTEEEFVNMQQLSSYARQENDSLSRCTVNTDSIASIAGSISASNLSTRNPTKKDARQPHDLSDVRANGNDTQSDKQSFILNNCHKENEKRARESRQKASDEPITISDDDEEPSASCLEHRQPDSSKDYLPDDFFTDETDDEESEREIKDEPEDDMKNAVFEKKRANKKVDDEDTLSWEESNVDNSTSSICSNVYQVVSEGSSTSLNEPEASPIIENNIVSEERKICSVRDNQIDTSLDRSSIRFPHNPVAVESNRNRTKITIEDAISSAVIKKSQSPEFSKTNTTRSMWSKPDSRARHANRTDFFPDDFFSEDEEGEVNVERDTRESDASVSNSCNSFVSVINRNAAPDTTITDQEKRNGGCLNLESQPKQTINCSTPSPVVAGATIDTSMNNFDRIDEVIEMCTENPHSTSELNIQDSSITRITHVSNEEPKNIVDRRDSNVPIDLSLSRNNNIQHTPSNQSLYWKSTQKLLKPVVDSRLNMYGAMRYRWPELFSRDKHFTNIMELCSTMTTILFYDLKPNDFLRSNMFIRMVYAIAARVAFGVPTGGSAEDLDILVSSDSESNLSIPVRKKPRLA